MDGLLSTYGSSPHHPKHGGTDHMLRSMRPGDRVSITLDGVTHEFPRDRVRISVDDTRTKDSKRYRYATVHVTLAEDQFPEVPR